ncbi:ATP-binding protein [Sinorhizobium meliloti]|uniref:AlbA family DNA-binding domain-containing protein n=1 Tax=Rhizobium meliloti TaxID=382 RepID=UPI000FD7BADC|nr:ATP-binding protein [Sinorhizobium meliloti]RVK59240.1 ATP-binding protein [Sinorhizobium meliloti]
MSLPDDLKELIEFDAGTLRVTSRESRRLEFKQSFDKSQVASYERTLAAFANTIGGVIVFGVADKPRQIVGTDPKQILDEADMTQLLRLDFAPEVPFETKTYEVSGLTLFAISVQANIDRPVICQRTRSKRTKDHQGNNPKDEIAIVEGSIYHRYSAQTTLIHYNELRKLLEEREERRLRIIMETLRAVERVGYEKVGVVDATSFGDATKATNLYVSKETARSMNFIDRGRFTETEDKGDPAYVVVGRVSLAEVIHAPLEEADKNLPNEVAKRLAPLVAKTFGAKAKLAASGIKPLLEAFGLMEMPYHDFDAKVSRRYITREGISELERRIETEPMKALQSFGSKASIEEFEAEGKTRTDADTPLETFLGVILEAEPHETVEILTPESS